jgi:hypothetical protein
VSRHFEPFYLRESTDHARASPIGSEHVQSTPGGMQSTSTSTPESFQLLAPKLNEKWDQGCGRRTASIMAPYAGEKSMYRLSANDRQLSARNRLESLHLTDRRKPTANPHVFPDLVSVSQRYNRNFDRLTKNSCLWNSTCNG